MRVAVVVLLTAACGSKQPPSQPPTDQATPGSVGDGWDVPVESSGGPVSSGAPAPAPKAAPASGGKLDATAQAFLDAHNRYRAKHCAPPLTWSPKLAEVAQAWASELQRKGCAFEHSRQRTYGENLAGGTAGVLDPKATVAMWYDEIAKYNFAKGGFAMDTGHFTQVVWTTTTQLGCGWITCKSMDIIVCNYDPPGNWEGQYKQHVLPATCTK